MHLQTLILRNFRNYERAEVSFSPTTNLFLGDNGQGKTNLLEAIYLLSTGRSFRTHQLSELIKEGADFFYLEGHFIREGVSHLIKIYYDPKQKRIQYDATISSHFTCLLGVLPGVLLSPEDHQIISGAPSERRRFFDIYLSQTDPLYIQYLSRYFRAMKQRNHLLKTKNTTTLGAWEETMAGAASYLINKREMGATTFIPLLKKWTEILSLGKDHVQLAYTPSLRAHELTKKWGQTRSRELLMGSTLFGPHRDEMEILLNGKKAKDFSSEGQKRSMMTALRFSEWELLKETLCSPPLLGIDDFGIQLDQGRASILQENIHNLTQVFLTAARPLPLATDHTLHINAGSIQGS